MISGSVKPHDPGPKYSPASMDGPPPRTGSAASNRTARSIGSETVLTRLTFQTKGNKLVPLDLTKSADEIIPYLAPSVGKIAGNDGLDLSIYEITITSVKDNATEPVSSALIDIEYSWGAIVEFIRENRIDGFKKAECHLAIT